MGVLKQDDNRDPWQVHLDPAGIAWGQEEEDPAWMSRQFWKKPGKLSNEQLLSQWEAFQEAGSLAGALNRSGTSRGSNRRFGRLEKEIGQRGLSTEGIDVADFSEGVFDPTQTRQAQAALAAFNRRKWHATGNFDRAANRWGRKTDQDIATLLKERQTEEAKDYWGEEVDPDMAKAQEKISGLLETSAISATQEMELRSKIASQNRMASENRLRRASAALGLRGLDPSSPAGAALALRDAEDADAELVNTLRDLGLEVSEINRTDLQKNSGLLSTLATRRLAARDAALSGDYNALVQMQVDMGSLIDALGTRDEAAKLQEKALGVQEDAGDKAMYGQLAGAVGGTAGMAGLLALLI